MIGALFLLVFYALVLYNTIESLTKKKPLASGVSKVGIGLNSRSVDFCRYYRKHLLRVRAPPFICLFDFRLFSSTVFFFCHRISSWNRNSGNAKQARIIQEENLLAHHWNQAHWKFYDTAYWRTKVIENQQIEVKKSVRNAPNTLPMQSTRFGKKPTN